MSKLLFCVFALFLVRTCYAQPEPPAAVTRVLIISVDGLRPDMLLRAKAPHIQGLLNRGTFTLWARTTPLAITLPSHTSMLTGVMPRKHEIEWNRYLPLAKPVYPLAPTLFEVAKRRGLTTALVAMPHRSMGTLKIT